MNRFVTELQNEFGEAAEYLKGFNSEIKRFEITLDESDNEFNVDVFFFDEEDEMERDEDLTRGFTNEDDSISYSKALVVYLSKHVPVQTKNQCV